MVFKESVVIWYSFCWEADVKDITLLQMGESKYSPALLSFFKSYDGIEWDVLGFGALYRFIRGKVK